MPAPRPVFRNFDLQVSLPKLRQLTKPELGRAVKRALDEFNKRFIVISNPANGASIIAERVNIATEILFLYGIGCYPDWMLDDLGAESCSELSQQVLDLPQEMWATLLVSEGFLDEVPETIEFD